MRCGRGLRTVSARQSAQVEAWATAVIVFAIVVARVVSFLGLR
jgi:hypothetical protein